MPRKDLIYGIHPLLEAIESGRSFDKIFIRKGLSGPNVEELRQKLFDAHVPVQFVPQERLNRFTGKNHQGVVGLIAPIRFQNLENIIPYIYEQGRMPFFIMLDGITDIRNFGAIARTAEVADADALIIPFKGAASINADAMKTAAGALNYIPVCRIPKLEDACQLLKENGIRIVAAIEKSTSLHFQQSLSGPLTIILGAEGEGISPSLLKLADIHLKLPIYGNIKSLNVSVTAGVLIYEVLRQRNNENPFSNF